MSAQRDKGGSLVTNYSDSKMDPERARLLNAAELDYVNGIWNADAEEWEWPSYPQLAGKYDLPVRLINQQASLHSWVSRRERRKTEMIAFQNEQTRKRWMDEDRMVMTVLRQNIAKSAAVVGRLVDEHCRLVEKVIREEQVLRDQGEEHPIVRSGIRPGEAEALLRACETAAKTQEKIMARVSGLPSVLPEIAPPTLLLTAEAEQEQMDAQAEEENPKATLLEIYQEMRKIEEARNRSPRVIYGELDDEEETA